MTKEIRVLFLTALTLIFYAASIYLSQGAFIFPFPLNELIFLVVCVQFSIWHYKKRIPTFYILGISIFAFLGNEVYWSFILDDQNMYSFSSLPITDIFKLLSAMCIIGFGVYYFLSQKKIAAKISTLLFIALYIGSITYTPSYPMFYGLIFMVLGILFEPTYKPFHLIWILLLLLESSKYLTLVLNN